MRPSTQRGHVRSRGRFPLVIAASAFAACNGEHPDSSDGEERTTALPRAANARVASEEVAWRLRDVAPERGLSRRIVCGSPQKLSIVESLGCGCAFFDANSDGRLDVFVANAMAVEDGRPVPGPGVALYLQVAGGSFRDATVESGLEFRGWSVGVATGDFDADGDTDLFLGCHGPDRLYENRNGVFVDVAERAGIDSPGLSTSALFFDHDGDGRLDLWVTRYVRIDPGAPPNGGEPCIENGTRVACGPTFYSPAPDALWRNLGDGRFEDITDRVGIANAPGGYGLGVASGDFDGDGTTDIYVANDTTANFLWMRRGDRYVDEALFAGAALSEEGQGQAGMGAAVGDADGDGHLDIFVTNYSQEKNALYRGIGTGLFEDRSSRSGFGAESFLALGWSAAFADLDNDGDEDLFVANGHVHPQVSDVQASFSYLQPCFVYRNDGAGRFVESGAHLGADVVEPRAHRGAALADFDDDGDLDVLISVIDGPPVLLLNELPPGAHSLLVELRGTRANREGIGALVRLRVDGRTLVRHVGRGGGYLSSSDARAHFGLGRAASAEAIEVGWPGGRTEHHGSLDAGFVWRITEGDPVPQRVRALR